MAPRIPPIARIRLARSIGRLLRPTFLLLLAAAAVVAVAVLGPVRLGEPAWFALVAVAALLTIIGLRLAVRMLTVGVDVEESAVRVHWLGGERRYPLTPGPVTRVRLTGEHASSLRARSRWLGWSLGPARLRGDEAIHVVRLAPTATVILIPTELGRLAVAAASEEALLDALSRAARARQRLEELARDAPPVEVEVPPPLAATPVVDTDDAIETDPQPPMAEPAPRVLTGIERAMLEAQRAREQADAEMTRLAAEAAAAAMPAPAAVPAEDAARAVEAPARRRRLPWRRGPRADAQEAPEAAVLPDVEPDVEPFPATEPEPASRPAPEPPPRPEPEPEARPGRRLPGRGRIGVPRPSTALAMLPLVGAGAVWGVATMTSRLPDVSTDLAKLAALALVFSGPATSLGAIVARTWWPRLVGVVVAGGLVASAFIGRALLGPLN
jgi:hypothetical protein